MDYKITARDGNAMYTRHHGVLDLSHEFDPNKYYTLTADQALDIIIKYGRAEVREYGGYTHIEFHNDYD